MLFNSIEFLILFLPLVVLGFHYLRRRRERWVIYWLTLASLVFYAWWEPRYLLLLLSSAAVNFLMARALAGAASRLASNALFALGLVWNLGLLGFYKYAAFIVGNVALLFDWPLQTPSIILPLAISFFTFQQIAYLSDIRSGERAETSPWRYLLFVTFFPQLIAGPIVHHKEMLPQFARLSLAFDTRLFAPAVTLIVLGLAKKVLLADSLALFSAPGFSVAEAGQPLGSAEAWLAITAYTLQIYFDFSGYCDIAMGCALLFGVRLPVNFLSPYQSGSISEYWRRWHMTLSRFMRDYVYIPLGGNRRGPWRWSANLFATAAVSGLWHGAGWPFIVWGCIHGGLLVINHQWRKLTHNWQALNASSVWRVICVILTFLSVLLAFVYFRSADMGSAHHFYNSLFSLQEIGARSSYMQLLVAAVNGDVFDWLIEAFGVWSVALCLLALCLFIVFALPNALIIVGQERWGFEKIEKDIDVWLLKPEWQANLGWAMVIGLLAFAVLISLTSVSPFLYFQF